MLSGIMPFGVRIELRRPEVSLDEGEESGAAQRSSARVLCPGVRAR